MCKSYHAAESFKHHFYYLDILVIDDLAKRRINATAGELLYDIVDKLYVKNKRIWLTSNFGGKEFLEKFENYDIGEAVLSRLQRMKDNGDLADFDPRYSELSEKEIPYNPGN